MAALRLAVLVGRYPVLTETFVSGELDVLAGLGHHVRVEAVEPGERRGPAVSYRVDDGRGARLRALAWVAARHPLRCLADIAARRRWRREEHVPPLREIAPVARRIAGEGERQMYAHFATDAALSALRLSRLLGVPYAVTAHAYDIFLAPANLREKLERAAIAFTGCDYNARHLRALAPAARVEVVVMGVDPERLRRRTPSGSQRRVLAVGRLVEKKGLHVLAHAAERLPDVRIRVVGEGPWRGALEGSGLELLGARAHAEVRDLLEDSDLLAMPCIVASDGDRDSMPVVVKEAMAMELLVVASDEVGLPECVRSPWGRLVQPGDAAALAEAIRELLALAPAERAAAGAAGRAWVCEHADRRRETARLAELIGDACRAER